MRAWTMNGWRISIICASLQNRYVRALILKHRQCKFIKKSYLHKHLQNIILLKTKNLSNLPHTLAQLAINGHTIP